MKESFKNLLNIFLSFHYLIKFKGIEVLMYNFMINCCLVNGNTVLGKYLQTSN